jgi:YgiT-type zinc finger domain-containing protein
LQPHRTTYAHWHGEHFVVLPNVPAWRCDFCGETFYDLEILGQLRTLLGPETGLDLQDHWLLDAENGDDAWGVGLSNRRRTDPSN